MNGKEDIIEYQTRGRMNGTEDIIVYETRGRKVRRHASTVL